jgi:hypothetical protein
MTLYARVKTKREATGLWSADVDWSFNRARVLGSFSQGEARARARARCYAIGRAPLLLDGAQ